MAIQKRVLTEELLIENEILTCSVIRKKIIVNGEERDEFDRVVIRQHQEEGEKKKRPVISLRDQGMATAFVDLCLNLTLMLTKDITGNKRKKVEDIPTNRPVQHIPHVASVDADFENAPMRPPSDDGPKIEGTISIPSNNDAAMGLMQNLENKLPPEQQKLYEKFK